MNLTVIVLPVQLIVDAPIHWVHRIVSALSAQKTLLATNTHLKVQQLLLQIKLQKLLALERENTQLKSLLQSASRVSNRTELARLLAVSINPNVQQVIVNKGRKDHVYRGQPVLDAYGVLGQVVDVGWLVSKVLLVTDERFAIPVQNNRNGLRAIAAGLDDPAHYLTLLHLSRLTDIKVGDVFVTSGLGRHFPAGYPVGRVMSIDRSKKKPFITALLLPMAHLDQTQQVLLVWFNDSVLSKQVRLELNKPL